MRESAHRGKREFLRQLESELLAEWREERAAILEYDGGLSRDEAEAAVVWGDCPFYSSKPEVSSSPWSPPPPSSSAG